MENKNQINLIIRAKGDCKEFDFIAWMFIVFKVNGKKTLNINQANKINKVDLKTFLGEKLPNQMLPKRIKVSAIKVDRRFKRV